MSFVNTIRRFQTTFFPSWIHVEALRHQRTATYSGLTLNQYGVASP
ncbi:hypothetical protein NEIMUCOT_04673 [Neisseria mucosa ATCC 25996]|uniref:Uncharacterized protein n=1 Tax=Neisseria mucosa (strain ATCC 25996 / DSM 4631 / NCTC 10774 / M26) TaxID=546266 RepID=D2ZVN0_NEIM2|nr:hypothetical protein NEIMUCOT_04673 [Neisseria mucosa ATCC 25996]